MNFSLSEYRKTLFTGWTGVVFFGLLILGIAIMLWPALRELIQPFWFYAYAPIAFAFLAIMVPLEAQRRHKAGRASN